MNTIQKYCRDCIDEELERVELACSKLWELDKNRLCPGMDYQVNLQRGTKPYRTGDCASEPLFTFVKQDVRKIS